MLLYASRCGDFAHRFGRVTGDVVERLLPFFDRRFHLGERTELAFTGAGLEEQQVRELVFVVKVAGDALFQQRAELCVKLFIHRPVLLEHLRERIDHLLGEPLLDVRELLVVLQ